MTLTSSIRPALKSRSARSRTIPSPASCSATSPRCSATPGRSAAPSTNWCSPGPAPRSTRWPASRRAASSSAARWRTSCRPASCRSARRASCPTRPCQHRLFAGIRPRRDGDARGRGGARRARHPGRRPHRHRRHRRRAAVKLLKQIGADVVAACFVDRPAGSRRRRRRSATSACRCAR